MVPTTAPNAWSRFPWRWPAVVLSFLLLAGAVWLLRPLLGQLFGDQQALRRFIGQHGVWGPVIFMALQAAQVIVAPIPGHILAVASGYLFGPWRGTAYTVVGVGFGSAVVLLLSRTLGRPVVERLVPGSALARVDLWAARRGPLFFFVLFMLPFMPDDIACFAVGLSALPLLPMLALIILARFPGHFVSAWLGATAERLPPIGWAILAVGGLVLAGIYWRHRRRFESWMLAHLPQERRWEHSFRHPGDTSE
ncbi:MAG: TVP38/TMEM64 family protein [Candidatus Eisenbacteria bacterium]